MEHKFNLAGWILFVVCAGFFIISAIKAGDIWYLIGSVIFLSGCILFIIPLVIRSSETKNH
ncbi:cytochrome oxidase subunit III [Chloroflexota bacterium]